MNTKAKGAKFELACKKALQAAGWTVVKSSDSKGPADVVAIRQEAGRSRVLFIECKGGSNTLGPEQWNRLCEAAEWCAATPVLADKVKGVAAPRFWQITGLKTGRLGVPQPRIPFDIDVWEADAA